MKMPNFKKIKLHNYVDYILGLLLVAAPFIFQMKIESIESKIIVTTGLAVIFVNVITSHKLGLAKIISKKMHHKIDLFLGWFLVVSPLLFGFFGSIVFPHFLLGFILLSNTFFLKLSTKKLKFSYR